MTPASQCIRSDCVDRAVYQIRDFSKYQVAWVNSTLHTHTHLCNVSPSVFFPHISPTQRYKICLLPEVYGFVLLGEFGSHVCGYSVPGERKEAEVMVMLLLLLREVCGTAYGLPITQHVRAKDFIELAKISFFFFLWEK